MDTNKQRLPLLPLILCLVFTLMARGAGIVYSFLATDVLYAQSIFVDILPIIRQALSAMAFASAMMAAFICILPKNLSGKRRTSSVVLLYAGILFLDAVAVILYDLFGGVLEGRVLFAILYRLFLIAYSVILLLVGIAIASYLISKKKSVLLAAIVSAVVCSVVDLVTVIWSCMSSLIEWEFQLYTSEVYSMLYDVGTVTFACIMSAVTAIVFVKYIASKKK